jgi:hypothetical protein
VAGSPSTRPHRDADLAHRSEERVPPQTAHAIAVLLRGPYAHLGILVSGRSDDVVTGWRSSGPESAAEADAARHEPSGEGARGGSAEAHAPPSNGARDQPPSAAPAVSTHTAMRGATARPATQGATEDDAYAADDAPGVATLLDDGRIVLLLDPETLAERCTARVRRRARALDRA